MSSGSSIPISIIARRIRAGQTRKAQSASLATCEHFLASPDEAGSVSLESKVGLFTVASHTSSFARPPRWAGAEEWSHPVFGCDVPHPKELGHQADEEDDPEGI